MIFLWVITDFIDKEAAKAVTGALIVGLFGGAFRGLKEKEKRNDFIVRLVSGGIMASLVGYGIKDVTMWALARIALLFFCGFSSAEAAVWLSSFGKRTGNTLSGDDSRENSKDNEHKSDD